LEPSCKSAFYASSFTLSMISLMFFYVFDEKRICILFI
jgi:hypothetical protein